MARRPVPVPVVPVVPGLVVAVVALVCEVLVARAPGWRPAGMALPMVGAMALAVPAAMPVAMPVAMPGRFGAVTRSAAVVMAL
jgi:hypothetical protein